MTEIELSPSMIRFRHDRIYSHFRCGKSINEIITKIMDEGLLSVNFSFKLGY